MKNKPSSPKTVVAPSGCESFLTEGKEYPVIKTYRRSFFKETGHEFTIFADNGVRLYCHEKKCIHLNGGNWIIKERKQ